MSRRNYKELWEQLKVLVLCGQKKRFTKKELYNTMTNLELMQLSQDPMNEMLKAVENTSKEE